MGLGVVGEIRILDLPGAERLEGPCRRGRAIHLQSLALGSAFAASSLPYRYAGGGA